MIELVNCVVTSLSPTLADRVATSCKLQSYIEGTPLLRNLNLTPRPVDDDEDGIHAHDLRRRNKRHRRDTDWNTAKSRRERPDWGLTQLMRPRRAAPGVPLVHQPLYWRPSVCDSNRCGTMSRWSHVNLRSGLVPSIFGSTGRLSRPSSSRRTSWVPRTSPNSPVRICL